MTSSAKWFLLFLAAFLGALCLFNVAPAQAQTTVWSATLTVKDHSTGRQGCNNAFSGSECSSTSVLTDDDFTYDGTNYNLTFIILGSTGTLAISFGANDFPASANPFLTLNVDGSAFPFANNVANALTGRTWNNSGLSWSAGDMVSLSIVQTAVTLSASPNPVREGSSVTVTATLSHALSSQAVIPVTLTNNSAESTDYGTLSSITINSGSTSGSGTISTNHDTDEDNETFTVALDTANLPSGVTAGSPSSVQITIRDDEGTQILSVEADPPCGSTVTDTSERPKYTLTLTPAPGTEVGLERRVVTTDNTERWLTTSSISPDGRHSTARNIFAGLRNSYPGFRGFEFRLSSDRSVTAECLWTFREDPSTPDNQPPPDTDTDGSGNGGGGGPGPGGGGGGGGGGPSPPTGGGEPPPSSDNELPPGSDEEPSTSCPQEDREILESFYEMTNGENWDENEYWNSEESLGEWHGVETDEDGSVVSLRLSDNNLSGDMPTEELRCLEEQLVELALWGNDDLTGDVPEELALAVERAALRDIAEMLDINPRWFEDYGDPYDFEDWYEGVTIDDGRVTGLDLTGEGVIEELPESVSELRRLGEIMITTSSGDGGCALSPKDSSAFGLFLLTLLVFAVLVRKRARG